MNIRHAISHFMAPRRRGARIATLESQLKATAAQLAKTIDDRDALDRECDLIHAESLEVIAEWKAELEATQARLTDALTEAETWKNAYGGGVQPYVSTAAQAVMAPQGAEVVELDLFRAVEDDPDFEVSEYHSGLTGSWPKDIVEAAKQAAGVSA